MGASNTKMKSNVGHDPLSTVAYAYVGQLQRVYGDDWHTNLLQSSIIHLIIAYIPKSSDHTVYGIGQNSFGELGVGHNETVRQFTKLPQMSAFLEHPSNIYRGYGRFMLKSITGELYCCGNNFRGDLGRNLLDSQQSTEFQQIENHYSFHCDVVGDGVISNHTIIASYHLHNAQHPSLFAFGSNRRGQFGNYYSDYFHESNFSPVQVLEDEILTENLFGKENIVKIQCGEYHTLFLSKQGSVFSCGDNVYGQCGIYDVSLTAKRQKKAYLPVNRVTDVSGIVDVACGAYHNLCINAHGALFVFGDNPFGQLGFPLFDEQDGDGLNGINHNDENIMYKPVENGYFAKRKLKIRQIETGNCHSCVVDADAHCWLFGENEHGQIGCGAVKDASMAAVSTPYLFPDRNKEHEILVQHVSCGYRHTVILSYLNEVYVFGDNTHRQCSSRCNEDTIASPWLLSRAEMGIHENSRIETVVAGSDTTLIIIKNQ